MDNCKPTQSCTSEARCPCRTSRTHIDRVMDPLTAGSGVFFLSMQDQQDPDTLSQAKCPRTLEDTASAIEDLPGLEAVLRDHAASTWRGSTIQHSPQVCLFLAGCCLLVAVCRPRAARRQAASAAA